MLYPAHILIENNVPKVQTVQEHCENTANISAQQLEMLSLYYCGYIAGLLHDMGKFTTEFKTYLECVVKGKKIHVGSVIHSHGAARFLLEQYHNMETFTSFRDMTAELLSYACAAHHGLYDCIDERNQCGFTRRLNWENSLYQEAKTQFLCQCTDESKLDQLFEQAHQELTHIYEWINNQAVYNYKEAAFSLGLLARLLLSAVVEGDRQDTAQYMGNNTQRIIWGLKKDMWSVLLDRVESKLKQFPSITPIQMARQQISRQCKQAAEKKSGIYRLNVPTGAGKTLSSLRYALTHAKHYHKKRIIFTAPLLTILEQNAAVWREFIEDDSLILEHHSNVVQEQTQPTGCNSYELLTENWNAPIIITTLVQLLNTIFSGKMSCVRRFHALCDCVLIIDEVQTVPTKMTTLFNLAIQFLSEVCGTTVVLCSATQPCLEKTEHPILSKMEDLIPYKPKLWESFQRTKLIDVGSRRLEEFPTFIQQRLEETRSLLVICNTKQQARFLYEQMQHSDMDCFHLSAAMCPKHRIETMERMEKTLKSGLSKVVCISTQLIEAGVDISFDCVIRFLAGMDNVVQSAGRCNRNGESLQPAPVYLISCSDENLSKLPEIQKSKTASLQLLSEFRRNPSRFENDLSSDAAITYYYQNLYGAMAPESQDFPIDNGCTLFDLLSTNNSYANGAEDEKRFGLHQAFALAGRKFQVFEQETTDILVPYGDGCSLIGELSSTQVRYRPNLQKVLLEQAKPFTISIYQFQRQQLDKQNALYSILDGAVLVLDEAFYDSVMGLVPDSINSNFLEV